MATHTPGPWKVDGGGVSSEEAGAIALVSNKNFEADARLIAAAPDLLAAADAALGWFDDFDQDTGAADMLRAALAKAAGAKLLCEGCYKSPCECLPADASCDPE